jgi:hypothetical protein
MTADVKPNRIGLKNFKKPGKHLFWAWIAYQTIKGTLTTTMIWVPLLLYLWRH